MFRSFIRILFPQLSWKSMKRLRIICCMGIVKLYLQVRASLFTRDIVRKDKIKNRKTKATKSLRKERKRSSDSNFNVMSLWLYFQYSYVSTAKPSVFLSWCFSENVKREKGCKTRQRRGNRIPFCVRLLLPSKG